jgi:hypothetical protein
LPPLSHYRLQFLNRLRLELWLLNSQIFEHLQLLFLHLLQPFLRLLLLFRRH